MTDLFDPAFLERQQATYPDLDVRIYAAAVREMSQNRPVRNPNGLLVHWLRRAEKARRSRAGERDQQAAADLDHYAVFWVELLRLASTRGLSPKALVQCIEAARQNGFPKINARVTSRLAAMGSGWPQAPASPEPHRGRRRGQEV